MTKAYDEIVEFIAAGSTPASLLSFQASEESRQRVNLAFACAPCNRHKGSDVATVDQDGTLVALFHPRKHPWQEHFKLADALMVGISAIGTATVRILKMNLPDRIEERRWSKPFREGTV